MWVLNGWKKSFSLSNSVNHPFDFTLSFSPPTHIPPAPTEMVWVCFFSNAVSFLESSPSERQEWVDVQKRTPHLCTALYLPGRGVWKGWEGCVFALFSGSVYNFSFKFVPLKISLVLISPGQGADFGFCFFSQKKHRGGSHYVIFKPTPVKANHPKPKALVLWWVQNHAFF